MARSHAVYVVWGAHGAPVAGFTVKHELVTWWGRQSPGAVESFTVWRCGDGLSQEEPRRMNREELA